MAANAHAIASSINRLRIPGLDGIRGLAVLTIFIFHAQIFPHIPGELATTVFFFLSGFLITTLFVREWKKTGDINLGAFYFRRALRILPPLYVVLGIALAANVIGHVGEHLVPWKTAANFLQYTNYAIAMPRSEVGFLPGMVLLWSLAVDEHFYLFFAPLFRTALRKLQPQKLVPIILGLCAAILAWRFYLVWAEGDATFRVSMASDTRMDSILWGALLALWRNPALEPQRAAVLARPAFVALGIVGLLIPFLSHNDAFKSTIGYTIEGISLIPLFAAAMLHGQSRTRAEETNSEKPQGLSRRMGGIQVGQILESRFLVWTSQISYPLYLFSWLTLSVCFQYIHGPRMLVALVAFAITFGLASAMHLYLERPLARLRKKSHKSHTISVVLKPLKVAS